MTATAASVDRLAVGASGWSYPTWRGGFYPAGARPDELLRLYAERLPAVELNATGYRLPAGDQFARWAEQVPAGFRFAVKAPRLMFRQPELVVERARGLGERLGCLRLVVEGKRDDGLVERLAAACDGVRLALDLRDPSWDGVEAALPAHVLRVDDRDGAAGWSYLRFREPPWSEADLEGIAARVRPLLERGDEVFAFFRHEDEPRAPLAALRVRELLAPRAA